MHYNCLIIDDEKLLAESTTEYFNLFGISTAFVLTASEMRSFLAANTVDLILLDINLENESGFDLCKEIRKNTDIPILFISARQSDDDVIIALNIGGDDYIKKPYSLSVLLAKVKVVLKRNSDKKSFSDESYEDEALRVDFKTGKVYFHGEEVTLKAMEYKLLCYLISNRGRIVPKEELFKSVWGDLITGDGTLNVHIRHLREKIEDNPEAPIRIKTVWGRGYIFEK